MASASSGRLKSDSHSPGWRPPPTAYRCLRACGAVVSADNLVCLTCLMSDAKRAARDVRLYTPEDWQRGMPQSERFKDHAAKRQRELEKTLRVIVTTTMRTAAFPRLLAGGLSGLLAEAGGRSSPFRTWLAGKGLWTDTGDEPCSPSIGRSRPCSPATSG